MASLEDALKKAGLAAETAAAESSEPKKAADATESHAGGSKSATSSNQAPETVEERPCTKCGTVFQPKLAKHRLCPKCAEEHFTAAKSERAEKSDKPASEKPARPAGAGSGERPTGPRPERKDRPRRPEGIRPDGARSEGEAAKREPREARPPREREPRREQAPREHREPVREAPQGFPQGYLAAGYFSGKASSGNVMRDELFDTWARHVAGLLVSRGLSGKELRAFYGHVQRASESAKAGRDFSEVREEILKMRPVAAARQGRKLIPAEFSDFLDRNIEQVKDTRSLGAFVEHFQAVVGYTAGKLKK